MDSLRGQGLMFSLSGLVCVWLAVKPVDFRKGIDGLTGLVRQEFGMDPSAGAVYVFRNRYGESVRLLFYDGQGFWLCQKRLSQGRFLNWPRNQEGQKKLLRLLEAELAVLLRGGRLEGVRCLPDFRSIGSLEDSGKSKPGPA